VIFPVYCLVETHRQQLCICRRRRAGDAKFSPPPRESTDAVWQPRCQQGIGSVINMFTLFDLFVKSEKNEICGFSEIQSFSHCIY